MSPTKRKSIPVTTYFGGRLKTSARRQQKWPFQWDRPISVMKYVVTGMDLRLVGDIGNCA